MIKINLSTSKKPVDLSNVGGFDFTKLKYKAFAIALVLVYLPDFLIYPGWEEDKVNLHTELNTKQQDLKRLKNKIAETSALEKQIRELKAQEESLGQKLLAVKQAISEKRNPAPLLLYIAKNVPPELWIKSLSLVNEELVIRGESLDYTSIGNFVTNLKSSVFIKEANISSTSSSVRESDKRRIESFEARFTIGKFEQ